MLATETRTVTRVPSPRLRRGGSGWGASMTETRNDPRTPRARSLRYNATREEKRVWSKLRLIDIDGHFRRQAPVGPYFADFAHMKARLIVEIDGGQHSSDAGLKRDAARTAYLNAAGFRVLRFWNAEVRDNLEGVIETILHALHETPPTLTLPTASGGRGRSAPSETE
jgi:very-short-patch-repair endonuclease